MVKSSISNWILCEVEINTARSSVTTDVTRLSTSHLPLGLLPWASAQTFTAALALLLRGAETSQWGGGGAEQCRWSTRTLQGTLGVE